MTTTKNSSPFFRISNFAHFKIVILYLIEPPAVNRRLRLVGGQKTAETYSGRVEIQNQGTWGTVCSTGWDINDAQAICNMLGYR